MQDKKTKNEILREYFFDIKEIWHDIDILEYKTKKLFDWISEINLNNEKYDGTWDVHPDLIAGFTHRILNKISALSQKKDNEEIL